jgi:acetyl-CoA carboxylase/biotin carboxylase 1
MIPSVQYDLQNTSGPALTYKFKLPSLSNAAYNTVQDNDGTATPSRGHMSRAISVSDLTFLFDNKDNGSDPLRQGAVVPVKELEDIDEALSHAVELFPRTGGGIEIRANGPTPVRGPAAPQSKILKNICSILVSGDHSSVSDDELLASITDAIEEYKEDLDACSIRRLTFLISGAIGQFPRYFTFRGPDYAEDKAIRHVDPALAFQLELGRLSNFNIKPVFTENRNIHVYEAIAKNSTSDKRFFVRAVVTPGRIKDDISMPEYLISESNTLVGEILDSLEVVDTAGSDLNHIFLNFSAVFTLRPEQVEAAFGGFLERFGRRLWRLRVTGAEIRMMITDPSSGATYPLRAVLNNVSGYVVETNLYAEVKTPRASGSTSRLATRPLATCTCDPFTPLTRLRSLSSRSDTRLTSWEQRTVTTSQSSSARP